MPSFNVTSPDGRNFKVNVPEGATAQDAIRYVHDRHLGAPQAQEQNSTAPHETEKPSRTWGDTAVDVVRGVADGATFGFADEIAAGAQSVAGGALGGTSSYDDNLKVYRKRDAESGAGRLVGQLAGGFINPASRALQGAKAVAAVGKLGTAVLDGAAYGLGSGEGDLKDRAVSALEGGALSGVGHKAMGALSRVVSPQTRENVKKLLAEGVELTPGQIAGGALQKVENALSRVPGTGVADAYNRGAESYARAATNRVRTAVGAPLEYTPGFDRTNVQSAHDVVSSAYDKALAHAELKPDSELYGHLADIFDRAAIDLPPEQAQHLTKIVTEAVDGSLTRAGNHLSGADANRVDSALGKHISARGVTTDPHMIVQKDYLQEAQGAVRDAMERQNSPETTAALQKARSGFAMLARVEDAASRTGSTNGLFTPNSLQAAVKAGDRSSRHNATARGVALMSDLADAGKDVLPMKVGDSGTPLNAAIMKAIGVGAAPAAGIGAVTGMVNPTLAATIIAGRMAYSQAGQKALRHAMTSRPAGAESAAEMVRRMSQKTNLLAPAFLGNKDPSAYGPQGDQQVPNGQY
ncbi:hypothetical protein EUV02_03930 [Polymorphobacter arshaanensis]|uniref:Uncharacterized protein n=1 Tax=Glacieibacterium arshaanense TaxID=2511025 RepID=A0A4Y9ES41_9SPHN|nr:hypothetical protein [Polymorphobacter arshaanensis]TFU06170.1 hypothetical protein EUV02_03930 [Polymorphobacter arshaanensis]